MRKEKHSYRKKNNFLSAQIFLQSSTEGFLLFSHFSRAMGDEGGTEYGAQRWSPRKSHHFFSFSFLKVEKTMRFPQHSLSFAHHLLISYRSFATFSFPWGQRKSKEKAHVLMRGARLRMTISTLAQFVCKDKSYPYPRDNFENSTLDIGLWLILLGINSNPLFVEDLVPNHVQHDQNPLISCLIY